MDYYSNPIPYLAEGLLRGVQLGHQLRQARLQEEEFKTRQQLEQQRMSMEDVKNQMDLQRYARPVSAAGTVDTPVAPVPPTPTISMPDGEVLKQGTVAAPGYTGARIADPARTFKYGPRQYERKTQEEIDRDELDRATQMKRAGAVLMNINPQAQKTFNLPPQMWVPPEHVPQMITAFGEETPIPVPEQVKPSFPGLENLPLRHLPNVVSIMNAMAGQQAQNERQQKQITSTEGIAAKSQEGQTQRETTRQTAEDRRATERNKATIEAARIRGSQPTAAQNLQYQKDRKRRLDNVQRDHDALDKEERALHKERLLEGEKMKAGTMSEKEAADARAKIDALGMQVESLQARKADALKRKADIMAEPENIPGFGGGGGQPQEAPGGTGGPIRFVLPDGKTEIHFDSDEGFQRYLKDHPELQIKR